MFSFATCHEVALKLVLYFAASVLMSAALRTVDAILKLIDPQSTSESSFVLS